MLKEAETFFIKSPLKVDQIEKVVAKLFSTAGFLNNVEVHMWLTSGAKNMGLKPMDSE